MRNEVPKETVLLAAEELYNHAYKSVVRLIAKQKIDNPSTLMIHCVRREKINARLAELVDLGYDYGPDTSKEFCLLDGQKLDIRFKGNIGMRTRSNENVLALCIFTYICFCKHKRETVLSHCFRSILFIVTAFYNHTLHL